MLVPIAFKNYHPNNNVPVLAGDLGGTKINIALFRPGGNNFTVIREQSFHSKDFNSLIEVIKEFAGNEIVPDTICFAVAGPVMKGKVKLTNLSWQLDSDEIGKGLDRKMIFINDLEANAYGLAGIQKEELYNLNDGSSQGGNIGILAPGTGLGEAGLYWNGNNYFPFATEGGHSAFASRSQLDFELYTWLSKHNKYVCYEHVLSGPGIHNIFLFLSQEKKVDVPAWLDEQMKAGDPSAVISENAIAGKSAICMQTMDLFIQYLAAEASSLVLKYKATGGLYLGGGIPPKILPLLTKEKWQGLFFESDRMENLLRQTPVNVILNEKIPMLGAAYYAAYNN